MKMGNTVKIVNLKQVSVYIQNGVKPIDVQYTNRLVFIFNKDDTTELFKQWVNHDFE